MPFPTFGGSGGGARSEFVVSGSPFSGSNKAAAETARDTWVAASQSNRNELYNQDSDPFRVALCVLTYGSSTETQQWSGTNQPASAGAYDNNGWVANEGLDADEIQNLALSGVTSGQVVVKDATTGLAADSGARVMSDGTLLLPKKTRAESDSIEFGDITTLGEANSFLRIRNTQFPAVRFDLIDARERSTGASSKPRQFFLTEAENDFNLQTTQDTTITANPLTVAYTATLNSQTNALKFKTGAAMTNVRVRIRYATSPNAIVKYLPSEAAWIDGDGGYSWSSGDVTLDLEGTPFRTFVNDQYQIELRADAVSLLGNSSNFPYLVAVLQRGEFRNLAFESDVPAMIDDTSVADDKVWSAQKLANEGAAASKIYTYNTEVLSQDNVTISGRTTIPVTHEVPSLPSTGYPYAEISFQWGANNLVVYHADNTTSFAFLSSGGAFAELAHIQLNSSGQFHVNSNGGNVTGFYMKVSGFNMELH